MQEVFGSFLSELGNYGTLPAPSQSYLKQCFSELVTLDFLFLRQDHLKFGVTQALLTALSNKRDCWIL